MSIRSVKKEDLNQLLDIEEMSFSSDLIDDKAFKRFIKKDGTTSWLYVYEGMPPENSPYRTQHELVLGYILIITKQYRGPAIIHSFAAMVRGSGVGAALIEQACTKAQELKFPHILTHVRVDNPHAIIRYRKSGFRIAGSASGYYEDGMDAVKYSRKLK